MSDTLSVDFETFYSKKLRYSIRLQVAEQYCKSPLFEPYLISTSDGEHTQACEPKDFDWRTLEGKTLLSNNAYFDRSVYAEMVVRGWAPQIQYKEWICVANLTAYICNRRSLAAAAEFLLKVKVDKAPRDKMDSRHWADLNAAEKTELIEYAKGDALFCWQLFDKFGAQWPQHERRISELTLTAGMFGIQIDVSLLNRYLMEVHDTKCATQALIPWLDDAWDDADEFTAKPTSTLCISEQCRRVGIPCAPVISHDPDLYEEWELQYSAAHPWIPALSSWRSVNKMLKTLEVIKERLRIDGTLSFGSKYFGTLTGRVSGESRVNMYNMRKVPILIGQNRLLATDDIAINAACKFKKKTGAWPEWVRAAIDFRNLIIARPG